MCGGGRAQGRRATLPGHRRLSCQQVLRVVAVTTVSESWYTSLDLTYRYRASLGLVHILTIFHNLVHILSTFHSLVHIISIFHTGTELHSA